MEVFFLSILQGIAEFLPISSSAHIIAFAEIFHFTPTTRAIEISLNTVTLVVIALYFRKDLLQMTQAVLWPFKHAHKEAFHRALKIVIATIPSIIVGYFIHSYFDKHVHILFLMGWMAILFGVFMIVADRFSKTGCKFRRITYFHAFIIGCFQMLALIPGVSRSGATLIGARLLRYDRPDAAHFSFLMAIPVGVGALTLTLKEVILSGYFMWSIDLLMMVAVTFVVGYAALTFFMTWLTRHTLLIWGVYRILFGIFILYYFS